MREQRDLEAHANAKARIQDAFADVHQKEYLDRLLVCLLDEGQRRAWANPPTSREKLRYALKLANASLDAYKGSPMGDRLSRGDQTIAADLSGLLKVSDKALVELGLDPSDFATASGYAAALYIELEQRFEPEPTACVPLFEEVYLRFEELYPEDADLVRELFPEALVCEGPGGVEPDAGPPTDSRPHYVLANRGTELSTPHDARANAAQALGFDAQQYDDAVRLGERVYATVNGRVTFTGYSLGGGLASAQALATGAPAVTFNAAGLDEGALDRIGDASTDTMGSVTAYYVGGDPLSGLQDTPMVPILDRAVGRRAGVAPAKSEDLHGVATGVIPALERALLATVRAAEPTEYGRCYTRRGCTSRRSTHRHLTIHRCPPRKSSPGLREFAGACRRGCTRDSRPGRRGREDASVAKSRSPAGRPG